MQHLADPTMQFTSDEGEMIWSDNRSMSSDESVARTMLPQHHLPIGHSWVHTGAMVQESNGQVSSHSPEMDMVMDTTEAPPMVHSSSSSCAEDWIDATNDEPEEPENESSWEQGSDDVLMVPKIEPVEDDDFNLNDVMVAPLVPEPAEPSDPKATAQPKQKRPRGRPRKHPLPTASNTGKVTKGRSKTGCATCRKRKKKCDETKPRCLNCQKNAVICEGYPEKALWQSGKDKAEEERLRRESLPQITMPPLFLGVETPEDLIFWKHYINHVSNVFTVEGETKNAFKDIILQLAHKNQGLMHGILAVSSKHLDFDTPYGTKILADNPKTNKEKLEERKDFHGDAAMKCLREAMDDKTEPNDPEYETRLCARYAQMLCMVLQTMADGGPHGVHRIHMHGYLHLVETEPPKDLTFYSFVVEFFQYRIYAADLFWHPSMVERQVSDDWRAPVQISPSRLIGVEDGLLSYMTKVTTIRNTIRENMAANNDPVVDYTSLYRAAEIDASIRDWEPNWPLGDNRDRVGILFKQMVWIYLFRTIYPPSTPSIRRSTFSTFPPQLHSATDPPRRASMVATVSSAKVPIRRLSAMSMSHDVPQSCPASRNISRHNSMHENEMQDLHMQTRESSPPPNRRPPYHDQRIRTALTESFDIIESFTPTDPVQTLLLMPCFIIGTAAFEENDRKRVRAAITTIRGYTGMRNCDRAIALLEELWGLMQQGDWHSVWDWQALAQRAGLDFCI